MVIHTSISYTKIFLQFLKFGLLAWGGPVAQIAMMKEKLVDEEHLITPEKFKRVLAVYQVLPGPEAHELCVYFGMLKGRRIGGILAGIGFMLPGFLLMLLFSWFYVRYGNSALIFAAAAAIQPAVAALVVRAIHQIGHHVITENYLWLIVGIATVSTLFNVHFTVVLAMSGLLALLFYRQQWTLGIVLATLYILVTIVLAIQPVQLARTSTGVADRAPTTTISFLTTGLKSGLLTFGGAYTILPFLQHDAVERYGWLSEDQLIDGIAFASMLPAPFVIIATFVGYSGHGFLGAILMTLGVFLPAFGFTLFGHAFLERLTQKSSLHSFLDGVAAAVIGLIVVTAVSISIHVITTVLQFCLFAIALVILYQIRSKLTIPLLVLNFGILGVLVQLLF